MSTEIKAKAQATVTKPTKLKDFEALLTPYQLKIEQVAPKKGLQASRIVHMAAQIIWMNPKLHHCTPQSMLAAVMQAAMNGLNPSPQFQEVYFIPYGDQIQLQLGYRGFIKLCSKSALLNSIRADAVYDGDTFDVELGVHANIKHKPGPNYGDPKKVLQSYAIAHLQSGGVQFVVLPKARIERLRLKNKMQKGAPSGAWDTDYDQMAIAKAVKQLLKFVPLEDEYRSATFLDEHIASIDQINDKGEIEFPMSQEGSAEVVTEPAKEQTEDEKNQAAYDAEMKKSEGGTLPFQG